PDLEAGPDREFMVRVGGRWLRVVIIRIEGGFLGIFEDLTDIKNSEEAARRVLEANRTLLAELHHRVKNNLQVISSLINIQSSKMSREQAEIMRSLQLRIKSMAVIHEMLLSRPESSSINFASYVGGLTGYLRDMYQSAAEFEVDVPDVEFNIETAAPLGLIVGELVSNSIRHAFTDGGIIRISLEALDDGFILEVADNGRGLPDNFSIEESGGIGLELVKNLVGQLEGSIECHSNGLDNLQG
ncbi:MAG: sensor histidine kinase, partial [Methanothermobacter sp.]|nr:sensor histidine kinase [Methanothermobacter sp.]